MNLETEAFNNGADHYRIIVVTSKTKKSKTTVFRRWEEGGWWLVCNDGVFWFATEIFLFYKRGSFIFL